MYAGYSKSILKIDKRCKSVQVIPVLADQVGRVSSCAATSLHIVVCFYVIVDDDSDPEHEIRIMSRDGAEVKRIRKAHSPYTTRDKIVYYDTEQERVVILNERLEELNNDLFPRSESEDYAVVESMLSVVPDESQYSTYFYDLEGLSEVPHNFGTLSGILSSSGRFSYRERDGYAGNKSITFISTNSEILAYARQGASVSLLCWRTPKVLSYVVRGKEEILECFYDVQSGREWILPNNYRTCSIDMNRLVVEAFRLPEREKAVAMGTAETETVPLEWKTYRIDDITASTGIILRPLCMSESPVLIDASDITPLFLTVPKEIPQCNEYSWYHNNTPLRDTKITSVGADKRMVMILGSRKGEGGVFRCDGLNDGKVQFSWSIEAISK